MPAAMAVPKLRRGGPLIKNALISNKWTKVILELSETGVERLFFLLCKIPIAQIYAIVMIVATVFALYGVDVYILSWAPTSMDLGLYIVVFIVFIMFSVEWVVFTICKPGVWRFEKLFSKKNCRLSTWVLFLAGFSSLLVASPGCLDGLEYHHFRIIKGIICVGGARGPSGKSWD